MTKAQNEAHQANKIRNEIKALKRLTDHPNIITLVDYDSETKTPWHVTKYCSGRNLFRYKFEGWSVDDLKQNAIRDKLNNLAKAIGYANSKGIFIRH